MQEPNKRFLHTKHTCDPLSPYVGIIQIRFWVKASAYSQPACASTPFYDCITFVMVIVLTTVPLYTSRRKRQEGSYPTSFLQNHDERSGSDQDTSDQGFCRKLLMQEYEREYQSDDNA